MRSFSYFYDISDLLNQPFNFESVLVLRTWVKDETDSLEALNSFLILGVLVGKEAAWQAHLIQVLSECLVSLVNADHPIDDLGPVIERILVAREEVIFIEYADDTRAQRFNEHNSCLL